MTKKARHKIVVTIDLDLDEYQEPVDGGLTESLKCDIIEALPGYVPGTVQSMKII